MENRDRIVYRLMEDEMRESFLSYSMSVLVQRALPDARDGLKPVHRRILYAMHEAGLRPERPFKKSATVVGDVLGKYHPHGDSSVYDALVRLAQDFNMAAPLVQGQGNFGSIDGDPPAAYRYTEAKMSPLAVEMLADIDRDTVDFQPNFDDRLKEPTVLPSKVPNLLLNGSIGIAVGMSTSVPPHNLREIAAAIRLLCDRPEVEDDDLYRLIKGPDFPTGGLVINTKEVRRFYRTGKGRMVMRARAHVENTKSNRRAALIFTEIPYGVNKQTIVTRIASEVNDKNLEGIADLRDESDRQGIRIVVELKRDADPQVVLEELYKRTALQQTFGGLLIALVNGRPQQLSFRRALEVFVQHRLDVVVRRATNELQESEKRLHIIDGLLVAIQNIEEVVRLIKSSRSRETAAKKLRKAFDLSEIQAESILRMPLSRLTGLDVTELKQEQKELDARVKDLKDFLARPERQRALVRDETEEMSERFGRERRSEMVAASQVQELTQRATAEDSRVYISADGRAWGEPVGKRRRLKVGEDPVAHALTVSSTERIVVVGSSGKSYPVDLTDVPETSRGRKIQGLAQGMERDEVVLWAGPVSALEKEGASLVFVTAGGQIKRSASTEYSSPRAGGVIALGLKGDDRPVATFLASEDQDVYVATRQGMAIRFSLQEVTEQTRSASGMRAIRLADGDEVVAAGPMGQELVLVTATGLGKRIPEEEFPAQRRGGAGVKLDRNVERLGELRAAVSAPAVDALWLWTSVSPEAVPMLCADVTESSRMNRGTEIFEEAIEITRAVPVPDALVSRVARRAAGDRKVPGVTDDAADDESEEEEEEEGAGAGMPEAVTPRDEDFDPERDVVEDLDEDALATPRGGRAKRDDEDEQLSLV